MPRGESGSSPKKKRAAATDLHGKLSKDELIKRLKSLADELANADQADGATKYGTVAQSLVSPFILKHRDKDVKIHAACCLADILRIFAPDAPYDEEQLKAVFRMITNQLKGLEDTKSNLSTKYFYLIESLALVKSFNICLDMDFQDIILQLFKLLFQIVNENHSNKIQNYMLDVMCPIIEEGDSVPQEVLDTVLVNIIEPQKSEDPVAYKLASEFIKRTSTSLEPYLQMFFNSTLALGKKSDSILADNIYDLILELNRTCPSTLLSVVPQLEFKLKSIEVEERLSVTKLLGQMFSEQDSELATQHKPLWNSYLGRFVDISVDVRLECIKRTKEFLQFQPDLVDDLTDKLHERQRDPDERVRQEVVKTICEAAAENINCISDQLLDDWHVRREAMMCLGKLYKKITTGATENKSAAKKLSWLPSKLLHCYYHNTPENRLCVERILIGCLVPVSLEADQKMKRLLHIYCKLDDAAVSALHGILTCQQRVRSDITDLIEFSTGKESQDNETLVFSKIISLARAFPDAFKFQENLKKLREMIQEPTLRELLKTCINPDVGCSNVFKAVSDVVLKVGAKNPILETLKALLDRAAPLLVDEHSGMSPVGKKGLALLLSLAGVCPSQFQNDDTFQQLLVFLKNKDQEIVDLSLKMLALTGDGIEKVNKSLANYYHPVLSKLALKGTPCQAKHSLRSIAKISAASSQPFDRVFSNLVSSLRYECPLLLTSLTALGEIAVLAPALFETERPAIVRDFVVKELLVKDRGEAADSDESESAWCEDRNVTQETQAKIKGIHLLVKWLRGREGNQKSSAQPVLRMLDTMLLHKGDLQNQGCVSAADCSRLRLAAACGIIKIAQELHYIDCITLENFQQISLVMQDSCYEVRDKFTKKLHKAEDLLKLPLEYLGIFALAAPEPDKERRNQVRQMIAKNVKTRRDYVKQHSTAQACSHSILPEYALPCVIHMLAHHPDFKQDDHETLVQFRDYLWFFMEPILAKADNYSFLKKLVENVKQTKDAQAPDDDEINKNLYTVCDLALGLLLNKVHSFVLKEFPGNPVLPKRFFVPSEGGSPNTKSYLPKGFQFIAAKGQKKGGTVESKTTPSKTSSKTSAKSDKKKQGKSPKSKTAKTSKNTFKEKVKEIQLELEESSPETPESGFASPADEQPSPRKRGRPANSSEKTSAKKSRKESPDKNAKSDKKTSAKELNSSNKRKESKQKKSSSPSPPKSPQRRSPFVSAEKLSSAAKPSPRKARATKRLASELDTLPEDEPTPDSGTSSLDSPKNPLSTRQISHQSPKTKSRNEVNGIADKSPSKLKRKKDAEESKPSPVKKSKVSHSSPTKRKEPPLVVKRKISKRR
ncbi:Sister chromatid cohesion protein PDS5 A [Desmophyllum pertusum]|uniref:Sister chromatid cohesion protein PDS5 A n=1 Tax=Desmophyllum pertusum TaxID=174260 RepID=A0A9W9YQW4_9CNID|nr:Sister chromatid cohesion protein PDS5 A [Desmophyllum pertusum]